MKDDYDLVIPRMERKDGKGQGKLFYGDEIMAVRYYEMFVTSALSLACH